MDKGINLIAAKDLLVKIVSSNDSMSTRFSSIVQLVNNANANYSSDNKALLVGRQEKIINNFSKLKNYGRNHAIVIKKNIDKYSRDQVKNTSILEK